MRCEGNRESDNVEDRRDEYDGGGGGGGGSPIFGGRSIGIGTLVVALVGGWVLGINPLTILGLLSGGGGPPPQVHTQGPAHRPPADDKMARFVSTVLADTEDVWRGVFQQGGGHYQEPRLVLFRGATPTACGTGQASTGQIKLQILGSVAGLINLDLGVALAQAKGTITDIVCASNVPTTLGRFWPKIA